MSNLIVFDLDGVITNEEAYWDAAGLTLHEISYSHRLWNLDQRESGGDGMYHPVTSADESRRVSRETLPTSEILAYKARAINSNWDTCYAAVCLRLISLLAQLPDITPILPLRPWNGGWLANFRQIYRISAAMARLQGKPVHLDQAAIPGLLDSSPVFKGYVGLDLINRFDVYATETLGHPIDTVFSRLSPFWTFCRDIFQEWYLGDELYQQTYKRQPAQRGKPGCIHFEQPLLPVDQMCRALEMLRREGYTLGFATGRVRQEALYPLKAYDLLQYFDEVHISTYDDVEAAEAELRKSGDQTLLGKPHPFQFLVASNRRYWPVILLSQTLGRPVALEGASPVPFVVVGDAPSDIIGGRAAGAITVAVQTGARTVEAQTVLAESEPDFGVEDVTKLPALLAFMDSLKTIQRLQFTQREKAEKLLHRWFARHMHLAVDSVKLVPKAVSLNSFNGFFHLHDNEFFFKTHVEEQGVVPEYYHAELLHEAGYNIVMPLRTLHEEGRQMVIYPVVHWPVMFDLVREIETGRSGENMAGTVIEAEQRECDRLLAIYEQTLARSTAEEHAQAPIHQLFWHRLAGERFKNFYMGKWVFSPGQAAKDRQESILFADLSGYRWNINRRDIKCDGESVTLAALIEKGTMALRPEQAMMTVIGHGDAHFGNVFLADAARYLYFDPAFAGRHSPLLDIIKPLFHNVFAAWMYFPQEIARDLQLSVALRESTVYVEHNYAPSPVRQAILRAKLERLLAPLLDMLRSQQALPEDWRAIMRGALMCCPLLTINLLDYSRIPAVVSWLGLSQVMEMGTFEFQ